MANKLQIHFITGFAWLKTIEVEGTKDDDLLSLIEEYHEEHGLPVHLYTYDELQEIYPDPEELETILGEMIPLNGGEFYIDGISHITEV